ncbi:hypothetical protein M432DRAFT_655235 [Thermoascus aurantiacus ATCC 26904]
MRAMTLSGAGFEPAEFPAAHPSSTFAYRIDYTGCGAWDPFRTYASRFPPEVMNKNNEYCVSVLWPRLTPGSSPPNGLGNAAIASWLPLSWSDPTARLRSLGQRRDRSIFQPQDAQAMWLCEVEAISLINQAIQDPARALTDAVILSVLSLATNRVDNSVFGKESRTPFQPPLRNLQWLDVYGKLSPNPVHMKGLAQLVMLRGGLEKIELPGLAAIISYADVLNASRSLCSPGFSFVPLRAADGAQTLHGLLGFGFADLEEDFTRFCAAGLTAQLAEVFVGMKAYTSLVRQYHEGSLPDVDLCTLTDQRNFVQYRLMSVPSASQLGDSFLHDHPLYEVCRLAGIIFGVGVIFPLPAQMAPFRGLVQLLDAELDSIDWQPGMLSATSANILLWVLVLGGIATSGMSERAGFVGQLERLAAQAGLVNGRI